MVPNEMVTAEGLLTALASTPNIIVKWIIAGGDETTFLICFFKRGVKIERSHWKWL